MPQVVLPPAQSQIRFKYQGTVRGQPWVNLFYAQYVPPLPTNMNTLAQGLSSAWNTAWAPALTTDVSLTQTSVWDLSTNAGLVGTDGTSHPGTRTMGTATPLPVNVAYCISWKVNYRWRGGHFRTYLPSGIGTDITSGKTLAGSLVTLLQTQAQAFITAINSLVAGTSPLVLTGVRYYGHGGSETTPPTPLPTPIILPIQSYAVHTRVDSMRRRTGKEQY